VVADLSAKMVFVDSFRDVSMTGDLAREIKNEIETFQHNTDIATFRYTFNEYCDDLFTNYGVYAVNTDLKVRDYKCLYLAYTYTMIEVNAKSVMISMINKLTSSGEEYLSDLSNGFFQVQEFLLETDKTWLWSIFEGKGNFICAAFRHVSAMWADESERNYALIYIGSIDAKLKTYIEDYDCSEKFKNGK
jgi:hypothetical protein